MSNQIFYTFVECFLLYQTLVAETEEFYTDAHSEIGSDLELESNHVSETEPSSEDDENEEYDWAKNEPFHPIIQQFDEPTGLTTHITSFLNENSSPLEIFEYFWDHEMVSDIADQTNIYVDQIKETRPNAMKDWKVLTIDVLWRFFGLHLLMGLVKKPTIKDYWTTNPLLKTPIFGQMLSRNVFENIMRGLHFANNVNPHPTDRFWKLGKTCTSLLEKYEKMLNPGEIVCIYESLLKFKGKLSFKQYLPFKRSRFGIKFYGLVDHATKILLNYLPYQGKNSSIGTEPMRAKYGMGGSVVLTMVRNLLGKFRKIVIDNWFTSPALALKLLKERTYSLGTVRKNRKNMPQMNSKLGKGQCETFTANGILIEK